MWKFYLFNAVLFLALTPGILTRIPPTGDKFTVGVVHALLFAVIHHILSRYVKTMEFFLPNTNVNAECPAGSTRDGLECRLP
jgi:hypothetical protein